MRPFFSFILESLVRRYYLRIVFMYAKLRTYISMLNCIIDSSTGVLGYNRRLLYCVVNSICKLAWI